ncbi:uncharacterized protein [Diabrotica undecimpunctata]|uniref:uncharacterized protein n=1 Tax=Diabrotica undecimpunctata TaxID=50387 RepID=UPI003B6336D2
MVTKEISKSIINFVPVSDRVIFLQLSTIQEKLNIVQIYAPTVESSEEDTEEFYKIIEQTLKVVKSRDITIIMGDWNVKTGKRECCKWIGKYSLGQRNERGDRLLQFCQENNFIIKNTFYQLPRRLVYTWKSPGDTKDHIIRNQIHYITINNRYKNTTKSVKTYPGTDIGSDYNPVVAQFQIKFKRVETSIQANLEKLEKTEKIPELDINNHWAVIKKNVLDPAKNILKREKPKKQTEWMSDEILLLMISRRLVKGKNEEHYKQINTEIKRKIRDAKKQWLLDKCKDIENLESKYDSFYLHKKVKEIINNRNRKKTVLTGQQGNMIMETEEKLKHWQTYIEELFDDQRQPLCDNFPEETGPEISKEEVMQAVKSSKNSKALGPDELPEDILKLIDEDRIHLLVDLFNKIYENSSQSENSPEEWLRSTFVPLPKKCVEIILEVPNLKGRSPEYVVTSSNLTKLSLALI